MDLSSLIPWIGKKEAGVLEERRGDNQVSVYGGEIERYSIRYRTEDGFEITGSLFKKVGNIGEHGYGGVFKHGVSSHEGTWKWAREHMLEHAYDWLFTPNTPGHSGSTMNRKKASMQNFAKAIGETVKYMYSGDSEVIPQIEGGIMWAANSAHAPIAIEGAKGDENSHGVVVSSPVYNPEQTAFSGQIRKIKFIARTVPDRVLNITEKATRKYAKEYATEEKEKKIHSTRKVEVANKDLYKSITSFENYYQELEDQISEHGIVQNGGGIPRLVIHNGDDQLSYDTDNELYNPGALYFETHQGIGHHPHKRTPFIYALVHKVARDLFEEYTADQLESIEKGGRKNIFYQHFVSELANHVEPNGNNEYVPMSYVDEESGKAMGSFLESRFKVGS